MPWIRQREGGSDVKSFLGNMSDMVTDEGQQEGHPEAVSIIASTVKKARHPVILASRPERDLEFRVCPTQSIAIQLYAPIVPRSSELCQRFPRHNA